MVHVFLNYDGILWILGKASAHKKFFLQKLNQSLGAPPWNIDEFLLLRGSVLFQYFYPIILSNFNIFMKCHTAFYLFSVPVGGTTEPYAAGEERPAVAHGGRPRGHERTHEEAQSSRCPGNSFFFPLTFLSGPVAPLLRFQLHSCHWKHNPVCTAWTLFHQHSISQKQQ